MSVQLPKCALLALTLLAGAAWTQTAARPAEDKPDLLHELSATLENLAHRSGRAVVQIFSTGYAFNADQDDTEEASSVVAKQSSTGSGVIISSDGYIVTNAHVVKGARRVQVQLSESGRAPGHSVIRAAGKRLDAKIVGIDRDSDLALIRIESTGLPFLSFGDSEQLHQGQLVLAFGNPLGLANSVTMGVVSSIARQLEPDDPMIYIQTDAPINPGNSGGPLLDPDGRVVGINTFILTQSGGSEGIGFAIPSNIVSTVVEQLRKDGHVHRGQIGVYAQTITPALAVGLRLERDWGVLLGDVAPGGPADDAGLQVGDIVVSLSGKTMENARQLQVNLYGRIGEKVPIEVVRGSQKLAYQVEVIERDDDPMRFADLVNPEKNIVTRLGILGIDVNQRIVQMLPDLRKKYGVVVAARAPGPGSAGAALDPGDVIYSLNGAPVTSVAALRQALDRLKANDPTVLQIEREGRLMFLDMEPE